MGLLSRSRPESGPGPGPPAWPALLRLPSSRPGQSQAGCSFFARGWREAAVERAVVGGPRRGAELGIGGHGGACELRL